MVLKMTIRLRLLAVFPLVIVFSCPALAADETAQFSQRLQNGFSELHSGAFRQAVSDFKAANKLKHGQCDVCYLGLAATYLRMREFGDSVDNCKKAIACASEPRYKAEAHTLWGDVLARTAAGSSQKTDQALGEYRQAAEADPAYAPAHFKLGVALFRISRDEEGKKELQTFLQLSPPADDADLARELLANPDRARFNFAPDFQATTAAGAPISLHQFAGKVVVLDFWATWCPPCRSSVPELKELSKKYSGDQLQLISISADSDREKWQGYIAKKKMDWPQIWDSNSAIRNAFGVSSFPTYLVIDRKGIIQQRIVGLNPQQTIVARLKQELAKMLE